MHNPNNNYLLAYAQAKQKVAYLERHLESLLNKHEQEIALLKAELLAPVVDMRTAKPGSLTMLMQSVCLICDITPGQLMSPQRKRNFVTARHLFFYLGRYELKLPWVRLGNFLMRDHSTVIHGCKHYGQLLDLGYKLETQLYLDVKAMMQPNVAVIEDLQQCVIVAE